MMTTTTLRIKGAAETLDRPLWLPLEQWPFRLRRYEHQRPGGEPLTVHYTDEGTGPVLVFVHAGMWSFVWRDVIAALRTEFRCIALDFPGSGLSGGEPSDVDLTAGPAILNGLLAHAEVESSTFVVHDLGGVVGVVAAAREPARLDGLVVTNSFGWPPDRRALTLMLGIIGSRAATGFLGTFRVIARASRSKSGVGRHYDAADREAFFGPYRSRRISRNFHRTFRSARRSTALFAEAERGLVSRLAHLPVLTVFGEKNDPFGFADRWETLFPNARRWTVPGANHFPMCDDPTGYAERLRDWHRRDVAERSTQEVGS